MARLFIFSVDQDYGTRCFVLIQINILKMVLSVTKKNTQIRSERPDLNHCNFVAVIKIWTINRLLGFSSPLYKYGLFLPKQVVRVDKPPPPLFPHQRDRCKCVWVHIFQEILSVKSSFR